MQGALYNQRGWAILFYHVHGQAEIIGKVLIGWKDYNNHRRAEKYTHVADASRTKSCNHKPHAMSGF